MPFEKGNDYRWKPGQSGNPNGRPKSKTLEETIRSLLDEEVERANGDKISQLEILSRVVVRKAIQDGDISTITLLAKRLWPEVRQHEVTADVSLAQEIEDAAHRLDRILGINGEERTSDNNDDTEPPLQ